MLSLFGMQVLIYFRFKIVYLFENLFIFATLKILDNIRFNINFSNE